MVLGQFSTRAMTDQLDEFTKVEERMDKMVAELREEQEEEVEFKAYRTKEFKENEEATYAKTQIEKLEGLIARPAKEIAEVKK